MNNIFIIGCGYVGSLLAQEWGKHNRSVIALARSKGSARHLQEKRIDSVPGDLDEPRSLCLPPLTGSLLYYLAPPPPAGDQDTRVRHFVDAIDTDAPPHHIIYISTSGVYGDTAGAWVTEQSPVRPAAARARRRLDAETVLHQWCQRHGVKLTLLRVAGIYGADKLPIKRLQQHTPTLREEECGYTNRIHIEDLVAICLAAASQQSEFELYNVSDGHPGTMTGYFNAVADALGLPRPPTITMEEAKGVLTPAMISYLGESRRLDNRKLLRELDIRLKYPSLKEGLQAVVAVHDAQS